MRIKLTPAGLLEEFLIGVFPNHVISTNYGGAKNKLALHENTRQEVRVQFNNFKLSFLVNRRNGVWGTDCVVISGDASTPWNEERVTHTISDWFDFADPESFNIIESKLYKHTNGQHSYLEKGFQKG